MVKKVKSLDVKDILVRATKTFLQAFFAYLAINSANLVEGTAINAVVIGAVSAGLSAVWNTSTELIRVGK